MLYKSAKRDVISLSDYVTLDRSIFTDAARQRYKTDKRRALRSPNVYKVSELVLEARMSYNVVLLVSFSHFYLMEYNLFLALNSFFNSLDYCRVDFMI